jgi:hypothetical protein
VSAAVSTTTAVEASATAVEASAATVETATAYRVSAAKATCPAAEAAATGKASATGKSATETYTATAKAATSEASAKAATKAGAKPRPGSDKEAAIKPGWAIVAIRCAGVGSVAVITIGTDGRSVRITIAITVASDANAYRDLCVRVSRRHEQNSKKSEITKKAHCEPP